MKRLLLLSCLLFGTAVYAQTVVRGSVTDGEGNPLIGVYVKALGTEAVGITDYDGKYEITVPTGEETLVFSYVGFKELSEGIGSRTTVDVSLVGDAEVLEEVVVVGYGVKKKRDVLGSVASVDGGQLAQSGNPSFVQSLQGRAAGVQVSQASGVPGAPTSVKIRGISSISIGTDPLWIIDGMPIYSGSSLGSSRGATAQDPMSLINPNDIESVEVLKDAAATAIYGSRGSNGVIIVTTKSGKEGKGSVDVSLRSGISDLSRTPEDVGFANTAEWFQLVETARANSNGGEPSPYNPDLVLNLFRDDPISRISREQALGVNTNWFDEILRTGSFREANLSTTQGFKNGTFYVSLGYRDDESVLRNNGLTRYSGRVNVQFEPVSNLTVETRLNLSYTQNDRVKGQAGGATGNNSGGNSAGFGNANRNALPWYPIYNSAQPSGYWNPQSGANLTAAIDRSLIVDEVTAFRALGGLFLTYRLPFVEGLSLRTEVSFDYLQSEGLNWITADLRENGSFASDETSNRGSLNYNFYGSYDRTFGRHAISLTVGTESQRLTQFYRLQEGQNLTGTYQELGSPQDLLTLRSGLNDEQYLRAYFGRADYKLNDRYLVGFSFRRDGSSKFGEQYRWGLFPAVSLGWILSEENFFDSEWLTLLKLRGSFGETGNNSIPANRFVTTYTNRSNWRYGTPDLILQGTRITNIGVPDLTWETTSSYDVGVDYSLWEGRVSGSVAYYRQDVSDLLLASPLAASAGLEGNRIWGNVGDLTNQGFELDVRSTNVRTGKFSWSTDFNISTNANEVRRLTPALDRAGRGVLIGNTLTTTGGHLRAYYMAEDAGVDPERGVNTIWEIDLDRFDATGETVKTGRKIPATQTNLQNHRIVHQDRTPLPTYFGGVTNNFALGPWDLSLQVSFSGGNYLYDYDEQRTTDVQSGQVVLRRDLIGNTWTPDNREAKYPELRFQGSYPWSWDPDVANPDSPTGKGDWIEATGNYKNESEQWTKYLYRADFIRLQNVQLGYNLPANLLSRYRLQNLRVYLSATNLLTWTPEYEGWDPETGGGVLPPLRILGGGLSVKF